MEQKRRDSLSMESLEKNLPFYLWNDLQLLKCKENDSLLDCILSELESDFNMAIQCHEISKFQEAFLKKKYFEDASEEELRAWFEQIFKN
jgi:hypothetical protein